MATEQIARGPAAVLVLLPDLELAVDQHRVGDLQTLDGVAYSLLGMRWREAGAVNADHTQPVGRITLVPCLHIRQRPDRVGPAEIPELDQHRLPSLEDACLRPIRVGPRQLRGKQRRDNRVYRSPQTRALADRADHLQLDESVELDRVLHR